MTVRARSGPDRFLVDLGMLGRNHKGVGRVLAELGSRLARDDRVRLACTAAALDHLAGIDRSCISVLPATPQSIWEQVVLPAAARRVGAGAVYSHMEGGALWGPPLVLHVPEDPEVRWSREPAITRRERARRRYSRALLDRSLARARVVASTRATAADLHRNHGVPLAAITVVPLGVDLDRFSPGPGSGEQHRAPAFFHLASPDPRDRSELVIDAFAALVEARSEPVRLVVGGDLGGRRPTLAGRAAALGVGDLVTLTGRLTDVALADAYRSAVATIHASPDEGFGLQPLEAMACGTLVISTPADAVAEVVGDGAVVWSEPDRGALAAALGQAIDDRALRQRARQVNPTIAASFTWERTAHAILALLEEEARRLPGQPRDR
ncbi:MAG: glycosyltransferase [Actinomycetota bacterium]|nr:glycosyltransferase [Actinomycetota bacterium]